MLTLMLRQFLSYRIPKINEKISNLVWTIKIDFMIILYTVISIVFWNKGKFRGVQTLTVSST